MSRWLADPRLRRLARFETVLLVVAVAAAAYAYTAMGQRNDAADERQSYERRLATAHDDLASLRSGAAYESLRVELERLEAVSPPAFPSLADALGFGTQVTEYAASQLLAVDAFEVASGTHESDGTSYPAVSYSIVARGPVDVLAGILSVPTRFPTSVIQDIEFSRAGPAGDEWQLRLALAVVHSGT